MAQTVQAGTTLDTIPPALALGGDELFWVYQPGPTEATPWIGLSCTLDQVVSFVLGRQTTTTMRQLVVALQGQGVLVEVAQAVPSDITNAINICWAHGNAISLGDIFVTGFLQPTLGYSNAQMVALFGLANGITFGTGNNVTMRQLVAALGAQSQLVGVYEALPSDLTNSFNIAWYHGYAMTLNDPFTTGFLQPTLGYSGPQMAALFALALSFPA